MELFVATAAGDETSSLIAFVVDGLDLDVDADHLAGKRETPLVLERLAERPELFVLAVGVDGHLVDQLIDLITHHVGHYGSGRAAWRVGDGAEPDDRIS